MGETTILFINSLLLIVIGVARTNGNNILVKQFWIHSLATAKTTKKRCSPRRRTEQSILLARDDVLMYVTKVLIHLLAFVTVVRSLHLTDSNDRFFNYICRNDGN